MRSNQLSYPAIAESECKGNRNFRSCKIFDPKKRKNTAGFFSVRSVALILNRMREKRNVMPQTLFSQDRLSRTLGAVKALAGLALLAAGSWEVIGGDRLRFSPLFLGVQFIVCLIFLCDFFVRWAAAERKGRFFFRNLPFLLLSVPYLNLMLWSGAEPSRSVGMLIGLMPLLRAFLAMVIVTGWLVGNKVRRLLTAYVFTVVVFTYISALVFYDYELPVNPKLHGFGNALWWAWMNVTTVGAEIFPVTAVGKVFCVLLPSLGMMFFPIFTTYVLQEYAPSKTKDE